MLHRSLRVHFLAAVKFHREAEIDENNNSDPYRVVTVCFRTRHITLTTTKQQPLLQPDLVAAEFNAEVVQFIISVYQEHLFDSVTKLTAVLSTV